MPFAPGFVGKIPSQGDFISRRLPWDFIDCWDKWLQECIGTARETLAERWLDTYLVAPIWRFMISPGACGPHGWLGLWLPSVDRVGRHFPLTVTIPVPAKQAHPTLLFSQEAWLAQVEDIALRALDPRVSLDQLDQALASLVLDLPEAKTLPGGHAARPCVIPLGEDIDPHSLARLLPTEGASAKRPLSFWHTWGTDQVQACYVVSERLPDRTLFPAYLTGQWTDHGLPPDTLTAPGPEAY